MNIEQQNHTTEIKQTHTLITPTTTRKPPLTNEVLIDILNIGGVLQISEEIHRFVLGEERREEASVALVRRDVGDAVVTVWKEKEELFIYLFQSSF